MDSVQPKTVPRTSGVAAPLLPAEAQVSPLVQAEQAVRTWPLVPTDKPTGVAAAVPVTKVPLAVIVAQGIPAAPEEVQRMALLAPTDDRTWPVVPQEPVQSTIPAPGLIALVHRPVSQLSVVLKPIAS